jgi:hypothetical protein
MANAGTTSRLSAIVGAARSRRRTGRRALMRSIDERLTRIERQLGGTGVAGELRHLEVEVLSLVRHAYLDGLDIPYPERLTVQRFRLASQNTEDGILLAIFREAGIASGRFVEVGAGSNGGNSGFFAQELGWSGLMIEADDHKRAMLQARFSPSRVKAVGEFITRERINSIVEEHGFRGEIDLLSIDIDGNDYWIWEALTACEPRVVVVEYNSLFGRERAVTIPYEPDFRRRHGETRGFYGASLGALAALGRQKGYRLVAVEPRGINAFFVRDGVAPGIPAADPADCFRLQAKHAETIFDRGVDMYKLAAKHEIALVDVN